MPNERNQQRQPNFWQRLAARGEQSRQGLMNSVPGTRNHSWQQTADALTNSIVPLDLWNSREGRWNSPREMFGFQPRDPNAQGGGPMAALRTIFGIRQPQTDPNAWGPPSNLAGPDGTEFGPDRSLAGPGVDAAGPPADRAGPAPRGTRPQLNTFLTMREMPSAAAFRAGMAMIEQQRRRQR